MPRIRLRKTERARSDISKYKHAYEEVKRGTSLRRAAEMHNINRMSLLRYILKRDEMGANHDEDSISMEYVAHNKVFSKENISYDVRIYILALLQKRYGSWQLN
ncbi:unnamed protein product [Pieris brassicae]|uniref:HTH psq-type domain-containing protein n=1 Tax=Pieris brassicae TaxID=7116 RepID=A0A9P0TQW5_PIEBR|nr:unnamed protein product [Pieris brassicae]